MTDLTEKARMLAVVARKATPPVWQDIHGGWQDIRDSERDREAYIDAAPEIAATLEEIADKLERCEKESG